MRGIYYLIPFLFYIGEIFAQGAKSEAMAGTNVILTDESSILNNTAGTASLKFTSFICSFSTRYSFFNTISAGAAIPCKKGVLSVEFEKYGNKSFNENSIGIGFGHSIQNISLGLKASYYQIHIEEYGTRGTVIFEFGGIAQLNEKLRFGAHISNFSQARIKSESLPVVMKAGLSYNPIQKVLIIAEIEKNYKYITRFKGGLEYNIIKKVFLRTGINTNPVCNSFGAGLLLKKVKIDYSLAASQRIGFSHGISLTHALSPKSH